MAELHPAVASPPVVPLRLEDAGKAHDEPENRRREEESREKEAGFHMVWELGGKDGFNTTLRSYAGRRGYNR